MPAPSDPTARYRFGPLERRGLLLGLGPGQLLTLGGAGVLTVIELRVLPPALAATLAVVILLGAVASTFWPIAGRPPVAWLPLLLAYSVRRLRGDDRFVARAHL